MGIQYENLDERVREFMLNEVEFDTSNHTLYSSPRLSDQGRELYPVLLRAAITTHTDDWLAYELQDRNCMNAYEFRAGGRRRSTMARLPYGAALTLAEGEFNRFYARGLCRMAIADGIEEVEVYRGRSVGHARSESKRIIGKRLSARSLLEDLRASQGVEPALGMPPGPNSGITIRIPLDE